MILTVAVLALAGQVDTASLAQVKETAYARVSRAQAVARDPAIRDAVIASNAVVETPEQIKRRDAAWIANPHDPLRQVIVRAPCSGRVHELVKDDAVVVEAFVMNDRGTLVCSINETSDYWQGDEAKWQKTFVDGHDPFVEDPAFDVSTGTYAIQVSVPLEDKGKRIGAVTLTLKLRHGDGSSRR
jgi:hypothetical protein